MKKLTGVFLLVMMLGSMVELFAQTRIRFARGRTSTSVSGSLGRYGERTYVLGARYGQYLSANVSSPSGCAMFANATTSTNYQTEGGSNYLTVMNRCTRPMSFTFTVTISN